MEPTWADKLPKDHFDKLKDIKTSHDSACMVCCKATGEICALQYYILAWENKPYEVYLEGGYHKDIPDCPTYYDGCNCTYETLEHNIQRAKKAEDLLEEAVRLLNRVEHETRMIELIQSGWEDSYTEFLDKVKK